MRSRPAGQEWGRGRPADRSQASRFRGSRISGQAVPGVYGSVSGRAQVRVDLAGDVALEAADDLGLGLSFFGAAFDVGAGGRVRSHAGEHDPPQAMVGLPVAAGVEPVPVTFPEDAGMGRRRTGAPGRPRCAAARGGPRPR